MFLRISQRCHSVCSMSVKPRMSTDIFDQWDWGKSLHRDIFACHHLATVALQKQLSLLPGCWCVFSQTQLALIAVQRHPSLPLHDYFVCAEATWLAAWLLLCLWTDPTFTCSLYRGTCVRCGIATVSLQKQLGLFPGCCCCCNSAFGFVAVVSLVSHNSPLHDVVVH